jgi:tetratricopeptide (TPR) repeat protein
MALTDYDTALRLDPNFAQAYNNRAVLYKKMGDRAKALADYEAALRLDPGNENAADGRRVMKTEIARFGSETPRPLHAPDTHPSFDCGTATLAVERAICADPQLGARPSDRRHLYPPDQQFRRPFRRCVASGAA